VNRFQTYSIAALAAIALVLLTAVHLDSQGAYYDELHQAPAAFHYIGSHPAMFTWPHHGIPLLNMTYSAAIKSTIYGAYLHFINPQFSIKSWRLLGIAFVAAGLFCFYVMAGPSLPFQSALLFAVLLLTDVSVLITTRHDWGPTALALALRLLLIGLWLSLASGESQRWKFALVGLVAGVSILEKLSSIVLIAPLGILLITTRGRDKNTWRWAIAGLTIAMLPLAVGNIATYAMGRGFISISEATTEAGSLSAFDYFYDYLSLGQGQLPRAHVFGDMPNAWFGWSEAIPLLALLIIIAVAGGRLSAALVATYGALAVAFPLIPHPTFVHHWIIATPFQYAAIAVALPALRNHKNAYKLFVAVLFCLIAMRMPSLIDIEKSFASGKASERYDPAYNRLMQLAAVRSKDALFISSDWGSATQIYCGSNGQDEFVYESFWNEDSAKAVRDITSQTPKRVLYVVTTGIGPQFAAASAATIDGLTQSGMWRTTPVEAEFANLGPVQIRRFVK
jgi:hypothetical protein